LLFFAYLISELIGQIVERPQTFEMMRHEARETVLAGYLFANGINEYRQLLSEIVSRRL
jgi:hypothetical protein